MNVKKKKIQHKEIITFTTYDIWKKLLKQIFRTYIGKKTGYRLMNKN